MDEPSAQVHHKLREDSAMTQNNAIEKMVQMQLALQDTAEKFGWKFRGPTMTNPCIGYLGSPKGLPIMYPCLDEKGNYTQEYELRLVPLGTGL